MTNNSKEDDCCGNCRYGNVNPQNVKQIACRRFPSQVSAQMIQTEMGPQPVYINAFPTMETAEWCGEYQPKGVIPH